MHLFSAHKTKPARRQKADSVLQFLSICIIVLFCLLQSGDKRPRVNRKFATEPPSQTRIKSLKKKTKGNTSHCKPPPCGGPHRATLTPLKSKNNTFCNGGGRGMLHRIENLEQKYERSAPPRPSDSYRRQTDTEGEVAEVPDWGGKTFLYMLGGLVKR